MRFTKMHGIGNDYVYVDGAQETVEDPASQDRLWLSGILKDEGAEAPAEDDGA